MKLAALTLLFFLLAVNQAAANESIIDAFSDEPVNLTPPVMEEPVETVEPPVEPEPEDYTWLIILLVFAVIILGILMAVRQYNKKKAIGRRRVTTAEAIRPYHKPDEGIIVTPHMESVMSALDPYERKVLELIIENKCKMRQNEITKETQLSKSKISRVVNGLASRNIVKTVKLGRMKRVELSESFKNVKTP